MAWEHAINRTEGPTAIVLTRQGLAIPDAQPARADVARGGYVRRPGDDVVLVATGSEVGLAEAVADLLADDLSVRVVSLPCMELFERQDDGYRSSVTGDGLPVFTLEAGATWGWSRYVAHGGEAIGIDHFGASAPASVLAEQFGFTPDAVADRITSALGR
jgi:transketolase